MAKLSKTKLKELLDTFEARYNNPSFIENDPISIPYLFSSQNDREVAAFLVSIIAWGNRKMIVRNGRQMVERLDMSPYNFLMNASEAELQRVAAGFVHRTCNEVDFSVILVQLQRFLKQHSTLGNFFESHYLQTKDLRVTLSDFRSTLLNADTPERTTRHISSIDKGSACKRLCMMLRWMVRSDNRGVDFGLWQKIPMSALYIPLDIHSARQGRDLGLLERKQNDWRAVEELTASLREFDPADPVRYDFALFGYGVDTNK